MSRQPIITLLSDFGWSDTFVGEMKLAIAAIAPQARVVDLTHNIPAQNIHAAAIALADTLRVWQEPLIHVAVVDPGVGSHRRAIAARCERGILIGPDNGVLSLALLAHPPDHVVHLNNPAFHRQPTSQTFHGRDIFAPVAAHLATGVAIDDLGSPVDSQSMTRLEAPANRATADGLEGHVLMHDHFGNLITSVTMHALQQWRVAGKHACDGELTVTLTARYVTAPLHERYSDVESGAPVAYAGSHGRIELAVRDGHAARQWQARPMDQVLIRARPEGGTP